MDWTALAVSAALVAGWTVASERGRDGIALGFGRGAVGVGRVLGAAGSERGLRAFLYRPAGGSQEPPVVVLAPSQAAVAEALIQGEGAVGLVDCLRTPYRIVRGPEGWAVVALPAWLSSLGTTTCEHGGHAENEEAARDLATQQAQFAPRGELEELLARSVTEMDAVPAFHAALAQSELWLVGASATVAPEGGQSGVKLMVIPWAGRDMIPAFTGEHRLPPVPQGTSVGRVPVRLLLEVIPEGAPHPIVLNPGSALPRVLEPAELALLRRAARA